MLELHASLLQRRGTTVIVIMRAFRMATRVAASTTTGPRLAAWATAGIGTSVVIAIIGLLTSNTDIVV